MATRGSCSITTISGERSSGSPTRSSRRTRNADRLALVGITRAARSSAAVSTHWSAALGSEVPLGDLDISFYRDDLGRRRPARRRSSRLPSRLRPRGRTIVLVDDVLYTGRTVRAAIDALFDYGRPARVQLAVLVDRGHQELPIRPDYVGKNLPTAPGERVNVRLDEADRDRRSRNHPRQVNARRAAAEGEARPVSGSEER